MLSEQEIIKAFKMWAQRNGFHSYESCLEPIMILSTYNGNQLQTVRKLQSLSAMQVAKKLKISRATYSRLEANKESVPELKIFLTKVKSCIKVEEC